MIVITARCAAAFAWLAHACLRAPLIRTADAAHWVIAPGVISLVVKLHGDGARRLSSRTDGQPAPGSSGLSTPGRPAATPLTSTTRQALLRLVPAHHPGPARGHLARCHRCPSPPAGDGAGEPGHLRAPAIHASSMAGFDLLQMISAKAITWSTVRNRHRMRLVMPVRRRALGRASPTGRAGRCRLCRIFVAGRAVRPPAAPVRRRPAVRGRQASGR